MRLLNPHMFHSRATPRIQGAASTSQGSGSGGEGPVHWVTQQQGQQQERGQVPKKAEGGGGGGGVGGKSIKGKVAETERSDPPPPPLPCRDERHHPRMGVCECHEKMGTLLLHPATNRRRHP